MTEAWNVIRGVKIEEAAYSGPPGSDQIVGILTANKIIDALNEGGFVIVPKAQYEDAIHGRTRLASGGYLSRTDWPR